MTDNSNDTKFKKGQSGNPKGRPKKVKPVEDKTAKPFDMKMFTQIVHEAEGDGVVLITNMLKRAHELGTLPNWVKDYLKIARDVSNYQHSKKASIETKTQEYKRVEFHVMLPDSYEHLNDLYRNKPQALDSMSAQDIIDATNGIKPLKIQEAEVIEDPKENPPKD
jgi:hypothetical protein